jgi:hypothetical protein
MIRQCRRRTQSPINIIRDATRFNPYLRRVEVENLDADISFKVQNVNLTGK